MGEVSGLSPVCQFDHAPGEVFRIAFLVNHAHFTQLLDVLGYGTLADAFSGRQFRGSKALSEISDHFNQVDLGAGHGRFRAEAPRRPLHFHVELDHAFELAVKRVKKCLRFTWFVSVFHTYSV